MMTRLWCCKFLFLSALFVASFLACAPKASAQELDDTYIPALQAMTEQLTITLLHQAQLLGMMVDAKTQLDTQRTLQQMMARANKDYLPSEALCRFGTGTRSLAQTEYAAQLKKVQISGYMQARQRRAAGTSAAASTNEDIISRVGQFRNFFCDPSDYKGKFGVEGPYKVCNPASSPKTMNKDIDFTRTLSANPSFALNLSDGVSKPEESAVFALGNNLYGTEADILSTASFTDYIDPNLLPFLEGQASVSDLTFPNDRIVKLREVVALRSVAQNTYASQVALKDRGVADRGVKPFMEAAFKGMGVTDARELEYFLGDANEGPSYDTQMNYLTKTLYQDPNFYVNLIDKPTNIQRQRASMQAFGLMQKRDMAEVLYRREMLLSAYLETRLRNNPSISRPVFSGGRTVGGALGGQ